MRCSFPTAAATLLLCFIPSHAQTPAPTFANQTITYSSPADKPLLADLYLPSGQGPFPAIIYVHGGGWWSGDRKQLHRQAEDLAAKGVFGMAIDYRLAPDTLFPTPSDDVDAAIRWLHEHAKQYNIDLAHTALMGSSAGAHLAMMHALTPHSHDLDVPYIVAFNPVLDLTDEPGQEPMVTRFLGQPCEQILPTCKQASPLYLARAAKKVTPHILILHGTADQTVPFRQAQHTYDALRAAGANVTLFTAPDAGHTFWSKPEWYDKSLTAAEKFLGWKSLSTSTKTSAAPK